MDGKQWQDLLAYIRGRDDIYAFARDEQQAQQIADSVNRDTKCEWLPAPPKARINRWVPGTFRVEVIPNYAPAVVGDLRKFSATAERHRDADLACGRNWYDPQHGCGCAECRSARGGK
jgi:hypothetical protein